MSHTRTHRGRGPLLPRLALRVYLWFPRGAFYAGSQAPVWEPSEQSSSFASREAGASRTGVPKQELRN